MAGTLAFAAAAQGTKPWIVWLLVAARTYTHSFNRTVAKKEAVFNQLSVELSTEGAERNAQLHVLSWEKPIYIL